MRVGDYRIAEVLELGESSTTAADDLAKATATATATAEMVGTFGMPASLGRLHLMSHTGGYLARAAPPSTTCPTPPLAGFDDEVRRLLAAAEVQATQTPEANRELLAALAARLEEVETLEGEELDAFLAQAVPSPSPTSNGSGAARKRRAPAAAPS